MVLLASFQFRIWIIFGELYEPIMFLNKVLWCGTKIRCFISFVFCDQGLINRQSGGNKRNGTHSKLTSKLFHVFGLGLFILIKLGKDSYRYTNLPIYYIYLNLQVQRIWIWQKLSEKSQIKCVKLQQPGLGKMRTETDKNTWSLLVLF